MQKIVPFLWFDNNAEEAVDFYNSVFKKVKTGEVARYPEGAPGPKGQVMTVPFQLFGQEFIALNGGPMFKFNEAVSFVVNCEDQDDIDYYWEKLSEGGEKSRCGWLKDKFGLSWQVVPSSMDKLMQGDPKKAKKAMDAILKMDKLEIRKLEEAYEQG